ncbi:starch synthase 3, chloroplastic/amyloplastic-like [Panicum miliaceum]|uniref:starch synthase n=1 Tax=Panicum miliaceum TaxID=4540 RepID=A0A3L6PYW0_PANMI|nr:starch synthase 3, chloroplastic/amyloplastic-like [Panicum miliaceum]
MEMALRAQSPLCSRGRPVLVVRPAAAATSLAQSTIGRSRFTGGRLVRCMVSSSDYPKKNPRRTSTPMPKGTASRGYASRPTAESSTKKIEQSSTVEGDLGKSNGALHGEATEQASTAEESSEIDLPGNDASSSEKDKAETKEEAGQNQSSASSSTSLDDESIDRKLDEYRGKISALVSSKPEPSSFAGVRGQDKPLVGTHDQEKSITGSEEHDSSTVDEPTKGWPFAEAIVGYPVKDSEEEPPVSEDGEPRIIKDQKQYEPDIQAPVEDGVDPEVLKRRLQELADENYSVGNKCFVFPDVVKSDSMIDLYLNHKSDIDEHSFEDFLVEEKQKELERLAAEEAERKREAEEERRREEERAAMEADLAQAKSEVEMKKEKLHQMLSSASRYADNLWYIEPNTYKGGDRVRLYYNRSSRPLMHNNEIWMHGGYNNWIDGLSISERLVKSHEKDGDWWYAEITLPERALVLDWVFADGPPGNARNYDNNGRQDFHAIVPNNTLEDMFWVEEEHRIFRRLQQERREREDADRLKAERSAKMKAEMKEKTMRAFLISQKHIVYTEPLEVRAGTTVDVFYNPSNTVLNGKPEVWFRGSFNRWTHPSGPLPPQKMVKAENGSHLRATVRVPLDAYKMDFVFSESEDGGIYDNRNGMDYHIPVSDSVAKEPPMHIVHIALEMAPIAKVGGLGDVVTSLSRAVQDLGHNVEVILPKYDCLNLSNVKDLHYQQSFAWGGTEIKVWFGKVEDLPVYFLEPQNGMFWVGCVYGKNDESRFGFFCHSALEFLLQKGSAPDIIHCHDWSSAPVAWLYKEQYALNGLGNGRVVFTIHNLEFGAHHIGKAMAHCDKATTVSDTYSKEVAGHGAIAPHYFKFHGIRNGIDPDIWDPYTDNFIPVHYTSENVVEGKSAAKKALQQMLGLQQTDTPIVGIISRLTVQKGIHLIKHAIYRTLERNGQVVLLGSAPDPRIQGDFTNLASQLHGEYHGRVKLCLTYDEPLSHLIYAGADFILVPSIFEPCGLTQLIAMRYGSIPIVRKTGGLYDTVFDVDDDKDRAQAQGLEPNGFSFEGADSSGVDYALDRQVAISTFYDARDWFNSLCKRVMEQDWSWNRPALDYMELYHSARKN